ncbi:hypothetical protein BCR36DRAFT_329547 [Piromyces finnis]|uniref:C2H2-type domain-containing protein n=1 Tax=Piromyces finnis TaxID=1754191 RepID=A0A1Y1V8K1_9FUNG|nr:hypothetical protein BCR36DRAFT_329547 [Piromyces finnis]|eukprot:ORX48455.1 hypothetical protein BCR36DRAFT_329547 [Piromyces finnis]
MVSDNSNLKYNPKKRPKSPDDLFFDQSDEEFNHLYNTKYSCIDNSNDTKDNDNDEDCIRCNLLPSCLGLKFSSIEDYEAHYSLTHKYYCSICNVTLMTEKLLNIHLQELHDTFFEVLSQRKNMYQCLMQDCEEKFKNAEERKQHLIEKHNFSKQTNINSLIKKRIKKNDVSNKLWNGWRDNDDTYGEIGVWDVNYDDEYEDEYEDDEYDEDDDFYEEEFSDDEKKNVDNLQKKVNSLNV